jgi:hypothetical protein
MRRRDNDSTHPPSRTPSVPNLDPPNAFDREFLDLFARRDPAPAAPEADNAGPWRVVKLHGDGAPRWGCFGCGEQPPRFNLQEPDVAHLVATGLAIADRPHRFRFQVDAPHGGRPTLHLLHDGRPVGTARRQSEELPIHLSGLAHLRAQPLALAHLLMAVPDEVIDRAGVLLARMLREAER